MNRSNFTLDEWLSWLESNHPVEIELGLGRCRAVWEAMDQDISSSKVISVAGTNGKGSTVAILDSIYRAAGYNTLCYTSPHLHLYNERVVINGDLSSDHQLVSAFNAIDKAAISVNVSLTYFEVGTLAALWLVAQVKPDIALLEVGLGGRLDAVNIVDADLSIVTTIGIDHVDWLGDDREKIGYEKAGIFRAGRPAVCGELDPPSSIRSHASQLEAPLWQGMADFSYSESENTWSWKGQDKKRNPLALKDLPIPSLPVQNAATALQALQLTDLACGEDAIRAGLKHASVSGRMSRIDFRGKPFILDVAHNPQSAEYLVNSLKKSDTAPVNLILGMLADKDIEQVVKLLKPVVAHWSLVTLDRPRGQTSEVLRDVVTSAGVSLTSIKCFNSVREAIEGRLSCQAEGDEVTTLIAGSFFTVGDGFAFFQQGE